MPNKCNRKTMAPKPCSFLTCRLSKMDRTLILKMTKSSLRHRRLNTILETMFLRRNCIRRTGKTITRYRFIIERCRTLMLIFLGQRSSIGVSPSSRSTSNWFKPHQPTNHLSQLSKSSSKSSRAARSRLWTITSGKCQHWPSATALDSATPNLTMTPISIAWGQLIMPNTQRKRALFGCCSIRCTKLRQPSRTVYPSSTSCTTLGWILRATAQQVWLTSEHPMASISNSKIGPKSQHIDSRISKIFRATIYNIG